VFRILIPKAHENEVLRIAEEIAATEGRILQAVRTGARLVDARREFGYHRLQTKRN